MRRWNNSEVPPKWGLCLSEIADVIVAERSGKHLTLSPVDPHNAEFQRRYPTRTTEPLVHRRILTLVKQPENTAFNDYLVVHDEFVNEFEHQQLNIHLLARNAKVDGHRVNLAGQWDYDMVVHFATATDLRIDTRSWHYVDEHLLSPGNEYVIQPGEDMLDWNQRLSKHSSIPHPDWRPQPRAGKNDPQAAVWRQHIAATNDQALIPPLGWDQEWKYGEYQSGCYLQPGSSALWILYPHQTNQPQPTIESIHADHGVRLSMNGHHQDIISSTEQGVVVQGTTLIPPHSFLPPLGSIPKGPPAINHTKDSLP